MHGRLKVRTSEEEAIRKKKEQELRVKHYRAGMKRIFSLRQENKTDPELMELTAKILNGNPDISTLWNIRREYIQAVTEDNKEDNTLYDRDLGFTEVCLQVNPKSYCAWHHRCWILENSPSPNWDKEVELCTKYLKMDERNFHCWDYRRYVVEKAKVSETKEFDFCTEKIQNNFSNYSSWHYRSKLLPILFPHPNKSQPINEEKLKEELELVLTAAFTDPNDSSAWFYQRWLLGYSEPDLNIATFRLSKNFAIISFTKAININSDNVEIRSTFCPSLIGSKKWVSTNCSLSDYDTTWTLNGDFQIADTADSDLKLILVIDGEQFELQMQRIVNELFGIKMPKFGYEFSIGVVDVLKTQLESCDQLLEFEPESKWTLLTSSLLMRAINRIENHEKTLGNLVKLQEVDSLRAGYYKDLASKWSIEYALEKWILESGNFLKKLDLSGLSLTSIYYDQYMSIMNEVDLSGNKLCNRNLGKLNAFQCCTKLNLSRNELTDLKTFPALKSLNEININFNNLNSNFEDILHEKCKNLSVIN